MTWPRVDYHTHICEAPIDTMLASAVEKGIREYGISEHIFQIDEGRHIFPEIVSEGRYFSRASYVEMCRERARTSSLIVRLGLEVDYVSGIEAEVAQVLSGVEWDYLIGSIHEIDGVDMFAHVPFDLTEGRRLWQRYYALSIAAVESGTFDVLSHPVRNMVCNPHVPEDVGELLLALAESAAAKGVALELNGEDTRRWPEMVTALARACGQAGCSISLGSDAHRPETVAQSLLAASIIAAEAGVPGAVSFHRRDRRILSFS
jgi:histidinol-phosphatase (PHP family)